jgi:hypothetical protein
MIRTYLVAINFNGFNFSWSYEFDSSKDRFYELFLHSFPWSLKLFEDVVVIQTEQSKEEIEDLIYDCIKRIQAEHPQNEGLFETSLNSESCGYRDLVVCEFSNHLVQLKDTEKRKYLEQMIQRRSPSKVPEELDCDGVKI